MMNAVKTFEFKRPIFLAPMVLILVVGIFWSCAQAPAKENVNENSTEETQSNEIASEKTHEKYQVEEALDPLKVYPNHAKVYADSLNIQFYELTLAPGDSIGLHEHLDHTVYVLEGGKATVWVNGTDEVEFDLKTGTGFLSGPLVDAAKNNTQAPIRLLITEIYRPRMD